MDQQQPAEPPMNGNDDLAKALNGGLQFEETPVPGDTPPPPPAAQGDDATTDAPTLAPISPLKDGDVPEDEETPAELPAVHHAHTKKHATGNDDELEDLKQSALQELRPLVGKLKLSPEERFDTLLLIIRSTDDKELLSEAHEAAKSITDENRRAQALLDIVKEVDYFSSK
jgi:hypothetical protein